MIAVSASCRVSWYALMLSNGKPWKEMCWAARTLFYSQVQQLGGSRLGLLDDLVARQQPLDGAVLSIKQLHNGTATHKTVCD